MKGVTDRWDCPAGWERMPWNTMCRIVIKEIHPHVITSKGVLVYATHALLKLPLLNLQGAQFVNMS
jgi:hypothetical protein